MSEPRDEIAEVLAEHADFGRVAEPRNNADRNLGRTRYEMRCDCGARLSWNDSGAAHREHLVAVLAEREHGLIVAAEQRGREDNPDHGMCYVSGSKALAERDRRVAGAALREAAEEACWPNLGSGPGSGHTSAYSVRRWLRDRADQTERGE